MSKDKNDKGGLKNTFQTEIWKKFWLKGSEKKPNLREVKKFWIYGSASVDCPGKCGIPVVEGKNRLDNIW